MTATTFSQFNGETEGLEVAQAFSAQVSGKVVLVTGVNRGGIGYSTAEALVREKYVFRSTNPRYFNQEHATGIAGAVASHSHRSLSYQAPGKR